jgi:hypothetical protein
VIGIRGRDFRLTEGLAYCYQYDREISQLRAALISGLGHCNGTPSTLRIVPIWNSDLGLQFQSGRWHGVNFLLESQDFETRVHGTISL